MTNTQTTTTAAVHCPTCGFISTDVWLVTMCPDGHGQLTDTVVTGGVQS